MRRRRARRAAPSAFRHPPGAKDEVRYRGRSMRGVKAMQPGSWRDRVQLTLLGLALVLVAASSLAACGADGVPDRSAGGRARQRGVAKVIIGARATAQADAAYERGAV